MVPGVSILGGTTLQLSVSPSSLNETVPTSTGTTSGSVTVSAVGGSGSYNYSWTRLSGSSAISAANPSAATTDFDYNFGATGFFTTTFNCEVDDGTYTENIQVTVSIFYGGV